MADPTLSEHFVGLLMWLHDTAWVQLGKVANPGTGKVERDLEAAKGTIDVLGALEEKSKGNLHAEEEKLLTRMLLDLRMNFVEEAKQGTAPTRADASGEAAKAPEAPGADATSTEKAHGPAGGAGADPPPEASAGPQKP